MSKYTRGSMPKTDNKENKQKALDAALSQIEKQFGKGSVMKMGDREVENVPSISTGSLKVDKALGIGGVPKGRVVEIYGPEGSGKCLLKDTMVWSERGLESIEEIFNFFGQKASSTSRVTDVSKYNFHLINERNELEKLDALTHNGKREVFEVSLEKGRNIRGTYNHPLRILNERGSIVWKKIGNLKEGDYIISGLFGSCFDKNLKNENNNKSSISYEEALFLGYIIAEGSLGKSSRGRIHFTNHDDYVVDEYKKLAKKVLGNDIKILSYFNNTEHHINSVSLRKEISLKYDIPYVKSYKKFIPHCIRIAPNKIKKAFLSSLFEGDGSIENKGSISYCSASEILARQVQFMLMGFGIPSSIRSKKVAEYEYLYWEVNLGHNAAIKFINTIGFRSPRRTKQWIEAVKPKYCHSQIECIPHDIVSNLIKDLRDHVIGDRCLDDLVADFFRKDMTISATKYKMKKIIDWFENKKDLMLPQALSTFLTLKELFNSKYTFEKVKSVKSIGEHPTFDFTLSKTHSFIANGILSHNTTMTLQVIAECQKQDGTCAFIDAEHALDPVYAQKLGVKVDDLLISQPDTGEQALEITNTLINSNAVDLIIIDSVAALVPRAEIEGEMGDSHMGLQARLMSQALRKITGNISKSKTTVIFINQIRQKIGVMWGSNETTTGGNALKFYASVRMDIRRIGSVKNKDEVVGNQVRVKVIKNKMAPPFKQVETEIIFGEGISIYGEVVDLGVENNLIEKAGAWYSYNGDRLGQGKENVKQYFKENPTIFEEIKQKIVEIQSNG